MNDRLNQARAEAESARNVSATPDQRGLRSRLARVAEPLARAQRTFNDAALKVLDALSERVDAAAGDAQAAERRSRELEERLLRLERRSGDVPRTVASQPRQDALPDYFAFEARMRAPTEEVRERQRPYLDLLRDAAPVLDVGCGRGELLRLLREHDVEGRGVDADGDMVAYATGEGLAVEQGDALAYLGSLHDGSLGAVVALQLVEHLPPGVLIALLEQAVRVLRPGGVLLLETINPLAPVALRHYFSDLTHSQPLVPETLEVLVRGAGFTSTDVRYLNAPAERLRDVELPAGEEWDAARVALAANARLVNDILFAPLDYALVARR